MRLMVCVVGFFCVVMGAADLVAWLRVDNAVVSRACRVADLDVRPPPSSFELPTPYADC